MYKYLAALLNLPWSIILIVAALISVPAKASVNKTDLALVIPIKSFWWYSWMPGHRGVRAMTLGSIVLLGPKLLPNDLEHELVHIRQHARAPFIHPILNFIEEIRHGYRSNKYEKEAYSTTGSAYLGHKAR